MYGWGGAEKYSRSFFEGIGTNNHPQKELTLCLCRVCSSHALYFVLDLQSSASGLLTMRAFLCHALQGVERCQRGGGGEK